MSRNPFLQLQPGGSFTASLHQLMQMSSAAAAASSQHIPGRPSNSSVAGASVDVLNDAAAAALVVGMPGAFQPKVSATFSNSISRFSDRADVTKLMKRQRLYAYYVDMGGSRVPALEAGGIGVTRARV